MNLSINQRLRIIELNSSKINKKAISEMIGCSRSTVYETLEKMNPRNGDQPSLTTKGRTGAYKVTAQIEANIIEYFTIHRFNSYLDCIKDLHLPIKSTTTISKILRKNGIFSRTAVTKPFINVQNQTKRYF